MYTNQYLGALAHRRGSIIRLQNNSQIRFDLCGITQCRFVAHPVRVLLERLTPTVLHQNLLIDQLTRMADKQNRMPETLDRVADHRNRTAETLDRVENAGFRSC